MIHETVAVPGFTANCPAGDKISEGQEVILINGAWYHAICCRKGCA